VNAKNRSSLKKQHADETPARPPHHEDSGGPSAESVVFSVVARLITHERPEATSLTDGQMVAWYDDIQKREGVVVNRYNRRHGRLLEINDNGIARILQTRGWPPRPHYEFVRATELEDA
jgi:hypothetical protein